RVPESIRRLVAARSHARCEYCQTPEDHCVDPFCIEHITPRAAGGSSDPENLAWSCQGCNSFKYAATEAPDRMSGELASLYDPRQDRWEEHFAWSADKTQLEGLTPCGRATIERLRLNRPALINLRRLLRDIGLHPPPPAG